jgi:hypothetical protein
MRTWSSVYGYTRVVEDEQLTSKTLLLGLTGGVGDTVLGGWGRFTTRYHPWR